eukprot:SAG31_NODE_11294_length_1041_cov_4.415873_3_plen_91_part_00
MCGTPAKQRAAEEAKTAREQEAIAARERRRRMRMAIGQAAVEETATSALVGVRDRAEWDSSLVLGIVTLFYKIGVPAACRRRRRDFRFLK